MSPSPQPSCMLSFLCNDKRDSEEPGHLKFLNALQESKYRYYTILQSQNLPAVEGGTLLCYDKGNEKSLVIFSF